MDFRLQKHLPLTLEDLKEYLDRLHQFLKTITYRSKKSDGLDQLTIACDELAYLHTSQLINHPTIINHPVFILIGQTLEMLLTKSNHSQSMPMKKHEEDAFYSISYLITQLCLYHNEYIAVFYGRFLDEIPPVTSKPNIRDETIHYSTGKIKDITEKPNLKTARLYPSAPEARPMEKNSMNLEMIPRPKKHPNQLTVVVKKPPPPPTTTATKSSLENLPIKTYQDIFLTSIFFDKLRCAIEDLSETDYPPYHVKYKVIDRLVRLCSKINSVDPICDSIVKCLCSNMYYQMFATIELGQIRLTPKQLFFIYRCPQLIIRHEFISQEVIPKLLCPVMIAKTKFIMDQVFLDNDSNDQNDRGLVLQGLCSHLELLNHLSLTSSGRRYFLKSSISDEMIRILHNHSLMTKACNNKEFFDVNVRIIAYALMLLCNLAYEKTFLLLLKRTNFRKIFEKLNLAKESSIKFANDALSNILSENDIDEGNEPMKLHQDYLEYLQDNVYEPQLRVSQYAARTYQNEDLSTKHVFLTEEFISNLEDDIQDLSKTEDEPNSKKYKRVIQRMRVCTKQSTHEVESLLVPVIACLSSTFYLSVFENIELAEKKVVVGAPSTSHELAPKHIFFMRECPKFLIQHGYQRQKEVNDALANKMIKNTITVFQQHLRILSQSDGKSRERTDKKNEDGIIDALNYHITLLNYFAMQQSIRLEFLNTSIIEDIISVLQNKVFLDHSGRIKQTKFIGLSLTLLYNLAVDEQILELMKSKNLANTCTELRHINDRVVQFTSQILLITLDKTFFHDLQEMNSLSKSCIEHMDRSSKVPKLYYHGIQLSCLLKNLKTIMKNGSFTDTFVEDQDSTSAVMNCVSAFQENEKAKRKGEDVQKEQPDPENLEKIQHLAIHIAWKISSHGPIITKTFKLNDSFVDQVLKLCKSSVVNSKKKAEAIIWKLGSEKMILYEQTQKEEERARNRRDKQADTMDDERVATIDQWNDSIPFDLLMSYSNNVNDKIISLKIADRLRQRSYRVYTEKQGKHRLKLMEIAAAKQIPILACLSSKFRDSKFCMAEVDYAIKQECPVIPVIIEENYTIKGWLNHIIGDRIPIKFTNETFNKSLLNLVVELEGMIHLEEKN
ncbi:unnamed protein product [Adineta steineri]|uniref:TIR domain-containing protein n=1 Tax=Adineta steineri TaxID=433720 RepID=A0A813ZF06_9BILA|nr:unnamed protein product [Adineta steineri]CAF3999439.1 unnamed protein product [Adineta steineri]